MEQQPEIPPIGFGTFGRTGAEGIDAMLFALETGYRHLDTAQSYLTEFECGEALRRSRRGRRIGTEQELALTTTGPAG